MKLKRKVSKGAMGARPDTRVSIKHQKWIRGYECLVRNASCDGRVVFAHVRKGIPAEYRDKAGGMGLKPHDMFGVPLCRHHHGEQHAMGEKAFWQFYAVDPVETALSLARRSPHLMRELRAQEKSDG